MALSTVLNVLTKKVYDYLAENNYENLSDGYESQIGIDKIYEYKGKTRIIYVPKNVINTPQKIVNNDTTDYNFKSNDQIGTAQISVDLHVFTPSLDNLIAFNNLIVKSCVEIGIKYGNMTFAGQSQNMTQKMKASHYGILNIIINMPITSVVEIYDVEEEYAINNSIYILDNNIKYLEEDIEIEKDVGN